MNILQAKEITGGLSKPSKMPCPSYSLPADTCKVGSKLCKVVGSVCYGCYARKGFYRFPKVKDALQKRYDSLKHPNWLAAMILLIKESKHKYFRWHDSGDLQGEWHLRNICKVATALPEVSFWLPTKEDALVNKYLAVHPLPDNLIIRVSGSMIDDISLNKQIKHSSMVYTPSIDPTKEFPGTKLCTAYTNTEHKCGSCRMCWDKEVIRVAYPKH